MGGWPCRPLRSDFPPIAYALSHLATQMRTLVLRSIFVLAMCLASHVLAGEVVVLRVNGEPVVADEYLLVMERKRAEVYAFFKEHHGLEDDTRYWESDGPNSPLARLRELARTELVEIKVQQKMALERGLASDISFREFRAALANENAGRTAALSNNEAIYGPRRFGETAFYYVRLRGLIHRLKHSLAASVVIKEEDVESYYVEHSDLFSGRPRDEARADVIERLQLEKAEAVIREAIAAAKVEVFIQALRQMVPRADPTAAVSR